MLRVTSRSWCFLLAKALQPQTFAAPLGLRTSQAKQNGRGNLRWLCAPATIKTLHKPPSAVAFAFVLSSAKSKIDAKAPKMRTSAWPRV